MSTAEGLLTAVGTGRTGVGSPEAATGLLDRAEPIAPAFSIRAGYADRLRYPVLLDRDHGTATVGVTVAEETAATALRRMFGSSSAGEPPRAAETIRRTSTPGGTHVCRRQCCRAGKTSWNRRVSG